jgi:hypothetical protein
MRKSWPFSARLALLAGMILFAAGLARGQQTNWYFVDASNPSPAPPYGSWADAAANLQAAVTEALAGHGPGTSCVVLVTNGTYVLAGQVVLDKPIAIRSVNGPAVTVVDGNGAVTQQRCFYVTANATIEGLTIAKGYAFGNSPTNRGGGLYLYGCTALVQNCWIVSNQAATATGVSGQGGGVAMTDGASTLADCLVAHNSTLTDGNGTGVYLNNCAGRVNGCVVSNHVQAGNNGTGAGLFMNNSYSAIVSGCLFTANSCSRYGANYVYGGTVTHCVFSNNYARSAGGGLQLYGHTTGSRLENSLLVWNRTGGEGGGGVDINRGTILNSVLMFNYTSGNGGGVANNEGFLKNVLLAANTAAGRGGGMYRMDKGQDTRNVTITQNAAGLEGGGLYTLVSNRPLHFINIIVYGNEAAGAPNDIASSLANYQDSISDSCSPNLTPGVNRNTANPPVFRAYGVGAGTNAVPGDYRLWYRSPCIDTGLNEPWMAAAFDLDGLPRIYPVNGAVDMGAYEFVPPPSGLVLQVR